MQCLPLRLLVKYFPLTRVIVYCITLFGVNKVVKTRRGVVKYFSGLNWPRIKTKAHLRVDDDMSSREKHLLPHG